MLTGVKEVKVGFIKNAHEFILPAPLLHIYDLSLELIDKQTTHCNFLIVTTYCMIDIHKPTLLVSWQLLLSGMNEKTC